MENGIVTAKKAPYTAQQIAQWFINRSILDAESNKGELLSNMKLQKLLYYAQGCFLALKGAPLFGEEILAWEHGPVVQEIYRKYKKNLFIDSFEDVKIDRDISSVLEEAYEIFGQFSAWKLRDMTHSETPWLKTEQSEAIPPALISEYFKVKYLKYDNK